MTKNKRIEFFLKNRIASDLNLSNFYKNYSLLKKYKFSNDLAFPVDIMKGEYLHLPGIPTAIRSTYCDYLYQMGSLREPYHFPDSLVLRMLPIFKQPNLESFAQNLKQAVQWQECKNRHPNQLGRRILKRVWILNVRDDSAIPSKDSVIPSKDSAIPSKGSVIPSKDSVIPSKDSVIPSKDSVIPSKDSVISSKDSVISSKDSVIPSKDSVAPSKDSAIPSKDSVISSAVERSHLYQEGLIKIRLVFPKKGYGFLSQIRLNQQS